MNDFKIGFGFDFHKLIKGNAIRLAGINIPSEYSVDAHSDGDIVFHALSDAIYGALAQGDIGTHFPSNNDNKNIDSKQIINHALSLLQSHNYSINNIDITIVLEKPHLQTKINDMRLNLAKILDCETSIIGIKSSTYQKTGIIGNNQGIACYVNILIKK